MIKFAGWETHTFIVQGITVHKSARAHVIKATLSRHLGWSDEP